MSRRVVLGTAVAAATLAAVALAATGDTRLVVQVTGQGALGGGAYPINPAISADGRYIAFESDGPRLHPDDRDSEADVFRVDTTTGQIALVSRADGRKGRTGDEGSGGPSIADDGNLVAFDGARDLAAGEGYRYGVHYVRDVRAGTTRVVTRASGARGALANGPVDGDPEISGDGRIVVFQSDATNLSRSDRGRRSDIYARNLRTNRTFLVSAKNGARGRHGDHLSEHPSISRTGRYVAFESRARNLSPDDTDSGRDIYVRDLVRNTTRLVRNGRGRSTNPRISADGRFVAFEYAGRDLDPADTDLATDVYLADLRTGTLELVSRTSESAFEPAISGDGRRVLFTAYGTDLDPAAPGRGFGVYLYDRIAKTTGLVSRASGDGARGAGGETGSGDGVVSADGRWAAFISDASNLDPGDTDPDDDLYLRDLGPLGAPPAG